MIMSKHYGRFARFVSILSLGFCATAVAASGQGIAQSKAPSSGTKAPHSTAQTKARTSRHTKSTHKLRVSERSHGHSGAHALIRHAQEALDHNGEKVKVDGMMGPHTRSALRHFQRTHGLKATGGLGPKTRQKLGIS